MREFTNHAQSPDTNFNNGFTLIEILISLTIIGILFSVGYSGFRDFSRRQVLSEAVKTIQGDLRATQNNAISGQKPAGCSTTLDSYSFDVQSSTRYTIGANCGALTVNVKDVTISTGVTLLTPSPNPLTFKILAQGTNVPGDSVWTLTLTQTGTSNTTNVTVTSGGNIQ